MAVSSSALPATTTFSKYYTVCVFLFFCDGGLNRRRDNELFTFRTADPRLDLRDCLIPGLRLLQRYDPLGLHLRPHHGLGLGHRLRLVRWTALPWRRRRSVPS